jgi:LPS export ABC transporter protein LptC
MPGAERRRRGGDGRRDAAGLAASIIAFSSAATLFAACSLAGYGPQAAASEKELPTAVFSVYSHTVVVRGKRNFELKADRAELYETSKKTVLSGVSFSEYDTDTGELLSLGRADKAIYHTDTKDAEFFGGVRLESKRQDAVLQGEYLRWIDKSKRLEGRLGGAVTISRADGSKVSGASFEADTRKRAFAFRERVEGRIESKDEPE